MTEFGDVTGYVELTGQSHNEDSNDRNVELSKAWFELGHLHGGYDNSVYNYGGAFTGTRYSGSKTMDEISLRWAMGGYGFAIGVGDPRDRWGSKLPDTYSLPDIVGRVTVRGSWGDAQLSAGVTEVGDTPSGDGIVWGAQAGATFKLDMLSPGDQLRVLGTIGTGGCYVSSGGGCGDTHDGYTNWAAFATFKHVWGPMWSSNLTGAYLHDGGDGSYRWSAAANVVWEPVNDFTVDVRGVYTYDSDAGDPSAVTGRVRVQYQW